LDFIFREKRDKSKNEKINDKSKSKNKKINKKINDKWYNVPRGDNCFGFDYH